MRNYQGLIRWILLALVGLAPAQARAAQLANITKISDLNVAAPFGISLDGGQIAFVGFEPVTLTRDVYFFDGVAVSRITNDPETQEAPSLSEGRIAWAGVVPGTHPQEFAAFLYDGVSIEQVSGNDVSGLVVLDQNLMAWPTLTGLFVLDTATGGLTQIFSGRLFRGATIHDGQLAWVFDGTLYLYEVATNLLVPISTEVDLNSFPSIHGGQIAWTHGSRILFWDGTDVVEIPAGDALFPSELTLFEGRLAWSGLDPTDFSRELYYFDGETTFRLTENPRDTILMMPSLYGSQLAFLVRGPDGGVFLADIVSVAGDIGDLIEEIEDLIDAGALNNGQGNSLIAKLEAALDSYDRGNIAAATNQVEAFVNQVEALVSAGTLTAAEGETLIEAANELLALLV